MVNKLCHMLVKHAEWDALLAVKNQLAVAILVVMDVDTTANRDALIHRLDLSLDWVEDVLDADWVVLLLVVGALVIAQILALVIVEEVVEAVI